MSTLTLRRVLKFNVLMISWGQMGQHLKNKYLNQRMSKHWKDNREIFFVVNLSVLEFILNAF